MKCETCCSSTVRMDDRDIRPSLGCLFCAGTMSYEAKTQAIAEAKGGAETGSAQNSMRNMGDCIRRVPQRGKPKQRTRVGTLRLNTSISADVVEQVYFVNKSRRIVQSQTLNAWIAAAPCLGLNHRFQSEVVFE